MIRLILENQIALYKSLSLPSFFLSPHLPYDIFVVFIYIKYIKLVVGVLNGVTVTNRDFGDQYTRLCDSVLPLSGELQFLIYKMEMMIGLTSKALLKIR